MPPRVLPVSPEPCTSCGACCFSELAEYLCVFDGDTLRLGEQADRLTFISDDRRYMRLEHGRCVALVVKPETGELLCSIYERRPDVCRSLVAGSSLCLAERKHKLDRARLLVEALKSRP